MRAELLAWRRGKATVCVAMQVIVDGTVARSRSAHHSDALRSRAAIKDADERVEKRKRKI